MRASLKKYIKERNEMLKKRSVAEYRKFVNDHRQMFTEEYITAFNQAKDEVLEIALHKMIVNVPSLPKAQREKSAFWLALHGYDLNTF